MKPQLEHAIWTIGPLFPPTVVPFAVTVFAEIMSRGIHFLSPQEGQIGLSFFDTSHFSNFWNWTGVKGIFHSQLLCSLVFLINFVKINSWNFKDNHLSASVVTVMLQPHSFFKPKWEPYPILIFDFETRHMLKSLKESIQPDRWTHLKSDIFRWRGGESRLIKTN